MAAAVAWRSFSHTSPQMAIINVVLRRHLLLHSAKRLEPLSTTQAGSELGYEGRRQMASNNRESAWYGEHLELMFAAGAAMAATLIDAICHNLYLNLQHSTTTFFFPATNLLRSNEGNVAA